MSNSPATTTQLSTQVSTHATKRLGLPFLVIPALLILIYGMLSFISLINQTFFYESMEIPVPEHEFLLWSWGGKNTAMLSVLVAAVVTRTRLVVVVSMVMLLIGQAGDINAGAQSGTNVFITWIAFGLVVVQLALLVWDRYREPAGQSNLSAMSTATA